MAKEFDDDYFSPKQLINMLLLGVSTDFDLYKAIVGDTPAEGFGT